MIVRLPEELKGFVHDQLTAGRYPSEDDATREALERRRKQLPPKGSIRPPSTP